MKKILSYFKPYKTQSALGPLFKLLEATFELFVPLVVAAIVDTGIANSDTPYIIKMCLVMGALGLIGLGCAPIYPCIIHSTPIRFGREKSQAFIGVQMASAYMGSTLMPPLFGLIANHISVGLYPVYMTAILLLMAVMHERVVRATEGSSTPVSRVEC